LTPNTQKGYISPQGVAMKTQSVTFKIQLTDAQVDKLVAALMPEYDPEEPLKRFGTYLRSHSPINRVKLMRQGKFHASEIDRNVKLLSKHIDISFKGKIPVYIWKETETKKS
jgi:hypothetical protein